MQFYVYTLADPRDGNVFYVGKGQGNRCYHHEREARNGAYSRKCDRIREIIAAGHAVAVTKVAHFAVEADAYAAEKTLIAEIGLTKLTNVMPGGNGPETIPPTPCRHTMAGLRQIAPNLARALGVYLRGGYVCVLGRDITDVIATTLGNLFRDLGPEVVLAELQKHDTWRVA